MEGGGDETGSNDAFNVVWALSEFFYITPLYFFFFFFFFQIYCANRRCPYVTQYMRSSVIKSRAIKGFLNQLLATATRAAEFLPPRYAENE
jgi:hypothetical protein